MHRFSLAVLGLLFSALSLSAQTAPRTDRLVNFSSRVRVDDGTRMLITGFVVAGSAPKQVIVRAIGPGLAAFGVSNTLPNPKLTVYRDAHIVHENDDWEASPDPLALSAASARVGAFPLARGSRDAAIFASLAPGSYTVHVTDAAGATGSALIEIYDAGTNTAPEFQRLVNISARGEVTPETVLISGFVVAGNTPKKLLIRGIGPALRAFGVTTPLIDPALRVYNAGGTLIAQNDNWETAAPGQGAVTATEIAVAATATGAFALSPGGLDAAIIVTLPPGAYTAHVSGNSRGIALAEVYEVP